MPLYQNAIRDVATAAKKHGKATGVLLQDVNEYEMYYQLGYRFLACGADSAFVRKGADELVKKLKKRSGNEITHQLLTAGFTRK